MNSSPSRRRRSTERDVAFETAIISSDHSCADSLGDDLAHTIGRDALLLQRVAVANGHRAILHRLPVDGEAEWRADLVLPAVAPPDRARLVIENWERRAQFLGQLFGELRHAVFLHQGEYACLHRRERGREAE